MWRCPKCREPMSPHLYHRGQLICPTDPNYPEAEKRSR